MGPYSEKVTGNGSTRWSKLIAFVGKRATRERQLKRILQECKIPIGVRETCAEWIESIPWSGVEKDQKEIIDNLYSVMVSKIQEIIDGGVMVDGTKLRPFTAAAIIGLDQIKENYSKRKEDLVKNMQHLVEQEEKMLFSVLYQRSEHMEGVQISENRVALDMTDLAEYIEDTRTFLDQIKQEPSNIETITSLIRKLKDTAAELWRQKDLQCLKQKKSRVMIDSYENSCWFEIDKQYESFNELCSDIIRFIESFKTKNRKIKKDVFLFIQDHIKQSFCIELQPPTTVKEDSHDNNKNKADKDRKYQKLSAHTRLLGAGQKKYIEGGPVSVYFGWDKDLEKADQNDMSSLTEHGKIKIGRSGSNEVNFSQTTNGRVKYMAAKFDAMSLEGVQRQDTIRGEQNVTDKKYGLLFQTKLKMFDIKQDVQLKSEPVFLLTHGNQQTAAMGTLLWDVMASDLQRIGFSETNEVEWNVLAGALNDLYLYETGKGLSTHNLNCLFEKPFVQKLQGDDGQVKSIVLKEKFLKPVDTCIWRWIYGCLNLLRPDPNSKTWPGLADYWKNELITGFISKENAANLVTAAGKGNILLRFRDEVMEPKGKDKVYPRACLSAIIGMGGIQYYPIAKELTHQRISSYGLGNILQMIHIEPKYIFPNIPFDECMGPLLLENEEKVDDGYLELLKVMKMISLESGDEETDAAVLSPDTTVQSPRRSSDDVTNPAVQNGVEYPTSPDSGWGSQSSPRLPEFVESVNGSIPSPCQVQCSPDRQLTETEQAIASIPLMDQEQQAASQDQIWPDFIDGQYDLGDIGSEQTVVCSTLPGIDNILNVRIESDIENAMDIDELDLSPDLDAVQPFNPPDRVLVQHEPSRNDLWDTQLIQ